MKGKWNTRKVVALVLVTLLTLLGSTASVGSAAATVQDDNVAITITEKRITWTPHVENSGMVLTISGPDFYHQKTYRAGDRPTFRPYRGGRPLPDGLYTYELQLLPVGDLDSKPRIDEEKRGIEPATGEDAIVSSGSFSILDGSFVTQDVAESAKEDMAADLAPADVLHYDDVIITGSLCVGFDCQNGESFGFDTQILKEHNLRIYFNDTSYTASYPTNNWRITINDSTNGGASYFSIDDADDGTSPFRIEAGAPSHSLYVEDYGRVGLGTSTPVVELHIKDSDTPSVRLEQDSSGGWTPQTWDVAGNESNFFIRDATNGSKLPFRIQPGAPSSLLTLKSDGRVGIGTWSPAGAFEVKPGSDSLFVVQDGGNVGIGTASPGAPLEAKVSTAGLNDIMRLTASDDVKLFSFFQSGGGDGAMYIRDTSGNSDVLIHAGANSYFNGSGNVGIGTTSPGYKLHVNGTAGKPGGGSWSDSSDARLKENIEPIDGQRALDVLNQLQGVTFEWINPEEHSAGTRAGLIAQDVEEVFPDWVEEREPQGSDAALIPAGEKAKALYFPHDYNAYMIEAVKALDAENQALAETIEEQDARIAALEQQNADLEARLTALGNAAGTPDGGTSSLPLGGLLLGGLLVAGVVASRRRKQ